MANEFENFHVVGRGRVRLACELGNRRDIVATRERYRFEWYLIW
jgi:hypothetical protein